MVLASEFPVILTAIVRDEASITLTELPAVTGEVVESLTLRVVEFEEPLFIVELEELPPTMVEVFLPDELTIVRVLPLALLTLMEPLPIFKTTSEPLIEAVEITPLSILIVSLPEV